jgi:hypothetical protein
MDEVMDDSWSFQRWEAIAHAETHRCWPVASLVTALSAFPEHRVFTHPVSGSLVVLDDDGRWVAMIALAGTGGAVDVEYLP